MFLHVLLWTVAICLTMHLQLSNITAYNWSIVHCKQTFPNSWEIPKPVGNGHHWWGHVKGIHNTCLQNCKIIFTQWYIHTAGGYSVHSWFNESMQSLMQLCDTQGCCCVYVFLVKRRTWSEAKWYMYLTTQPWAVHDSEVWKAPLLICNASGIHSGLSLKAQRPH